MKNYLTHLQCRQEDIAPIVLMPSNPAKAERIGRMLANGKQVGSYREFVSWIGSFDDAPVSVVSTGIGCPSTAIATEEVIQAGAQILIRVGTCGGAWRNGIPCGSLILPTACIREEGTTLEYVPLSFPAVADLDVLNALKTTSDTLNLKSYTGINRTHDAYYGSSSNRTIWSDALTTARVDTDKQPILSSEMECSALYTLASLRGVRAGAVLAVNADPEPLMTDQEIDYVPAMKTNTTAADRAEADSIKLVLQSLSTLYPLIS